MISSTVKCGLQCPARLAAVRPVQKPFTAPRPCRHAHNSTPVVSRCRGQQLQCRASFFDVAWGVTGDVSAQDLAATLFASSIVPYAGFLYCLTRSKKTPPMALFGFYFLLAFVFGTIPAGIYAKTQVGTTLANVDWLHGPAESLLTITNLFIVIGFRRAIIDAERAAEDGSAADAHAGTETGGSQVVAGERDVQ